jgi:hypothetical protein
VVLLIAIPAGYIALSAYQSRDSGQDKQRAAYARAMTYEWPSQVQRRIYRAPVPDGSTYVGHYEINTWDRSTLYIQFRTSQEGLALFLEEAGSWRWELNEGTITIPEEDADVVGWDFTDGSRVYAGTIVQETPADPEVAITVDLTYPERPRVYLVSTNVL